MTTPASRPLTRKKARKLAIIHVREMETNLNHISSKTLIFLYLKRERIEAPKTADDESYALRLLCVDWWARKLLTRDRRDREAAQILKGNVAKGREIFCSDDTIKEVKERWSATIENMRHKMIVSDCGDELDMITVMKSSLANPENLRVELMVRMAGFERYADECGDIGMFYTVTCPSKFHRFSGKGTLKNRKYSGASPQAAQRYLTKIWSQIRAELARWNVNLYGFRVAEPHADGTPHWHLLLFMKPDMEYLVTECIQEYALNEDSNEKGAAENRFQSTRIVKEIMTKDGIKKVSATGYIAKYISKNIGFDVGIDSEDATQSTEQTGDRVRAWASTWGIRQFQQIGGVSVTIWRELRRLKHTEIEDETIRQARDCCIASDWAGFLTIMGGNDIKRLEREIQLLKKIAVNEITGEVQLNKYQEIVWKIIGISTHANDVITHLKKWKIIDKSQLECASEIAHFFGTGSREAPSLRPFGALGVL